MGGGGAGSAEGAGRRRYHPQADCGWAAQPTRLLHPAKRGRGLGRDGARRKGALLLLRRSQRLLLRRRRVGGGPGGLCAGHGGRGEGAALSALLLPGGGAARSGAQARAGGQGESGNHDGLLCGTCGERGPGPEKRREVNWSDQHGEPAKWPREGSRSCQNPPERGQGPSGGIQNMPEERWVVQEGRNFFACDGPIARRLPSPLSARRAAASQSTRPIVVLLCTDWILLDAMQRQGAPRMGWAGCRCPYGGPCWSTVLSTAVKCTSTRHVPPAHGPLRSPPFSSAWSCAMLIVMSANQIREAAWERRWQAAVGSDHPSPGWHRRRPSCRALKPLPRTASCSTWISVGAASQAAETGSRRCRRHCTPLAASRPSRPSCGRASRCEEPTRWARAGSPAPRCSL